MNRRPFPAIGAALLLSLSGCIQPIPRPEGAADPQAGQARNGASLAGRPDAYLAHTFYDEDFQQGGFTYVYGGATKVRQMEGEGASGSEYFLRFGLDQREYSGAAVCLWNQTFDMTPILTSGALVFQARGTSGGEKIRIGLVDDESDGRKTVVRVDLSPKYGTIRKGEWTTFVVPLRDFGKRGVAWDAAKGIELGEAFRWDLVQEFRVITNRNDNPGCEVDLDNVRIWADAFDPDSLPVSEDWLDLDRSSDAPAPDRMTLPDEVLGSFFVDDVLGFSYVYGGGKTAVKTLESATPGNPQVLAAYMVNDYSGVTLSVGNDKFLDLAAIRRTGTLTFWVKGGKASTRFLVGLLDRQGPDIKVQTKVVANDFVDGVIKEGEWTQVRVPLKKFIDDGSFWSAEQGREVNRKIDWTKIQEVRFSIARDENKPGEGKPVVFYFDQVQITRTAQGMRDDEAYWNAFQSDARDVLLFGFDGKGNDRWQAAHGTTADISRSFVPAGGKMKGTALKIDFKPGDWFDVLYQMGDDSSIPTDWSRHWGLAFWMHTDKPYQQVDVTVQDRDHEMFLGTVGATKGWNQVILPFRDFTKYPYYQPPEAKQNGRLDLDGVYQISFKPAGDIPGTFLVKNIAVTNRRAVVAAKGAAVERARFGADLGKVVKPIGDVFGVNVGLWAPELIDPANFELQKGLRLGTVRYPGGLRSDEIHWEEILAAKDFHVDTDEFLDWCAKAGVEPMFTANVGSGTPEESARWVEYVNKKRKGPKVAYWEVGNELYGNWHKYYERWGQDGGDAYGKAAREHILAMKKVDPSIKVTVVWQLVGDWNRKVMGHVADLVDGVNVHHYAAKWGTENDQALLAVSGEADKLMEDVRSQVRKHGTPNRKYDIWLTEWNSVDFNPGPQILSHVNAIFLADYLGHLARSSVDKANLWALYNGRDKRLGDYGLLSTGGDPQGYNVRRPSYWAVAMLSRVLQGDLLKSSTDREDLEGWAVRRRDGTHAFAFVNKNADSDYRTRMVVPGLQGKAVVKILTQETSGGLKTSDAAGDCFPSTGPREEVVDLADGGEIVVPKRSIVTVELK